MHPIYTRGFDRCLTRVSPSVAAEFEISQNQCNKTYKNKQQKYLEI